MLTPALIDMLREVLVADMRADVTRMVPGERFRNFDAVAFRNDLGNWETGRYRSFPTSAKKAAHAVRGACGQLKRGATAYFVRGSF